MTITSTPDDRTPADIHARRLTIMHRLVSTAVSIVNNDECTCVPLEVRAVFDGEAWHSATRHHNLCRIVVDQDIADMERALFGPSA